MAPPHISIQIPYPKTFDFDQCLFYLDRGYDECLYEIRAGKLTAAIEREGNIYLFTLSKKGSSLYLQINQGQRTPNLDKALREHITKWFDLGRDLTAFYELLFAEKTCASLAQQYHGLHLMGIPDMFEALCWSIIGQQINLQFAYRLKRRLVERYGRSIRYEGKSWYVFPHPSKLKHADPTELKHMQFSRQKITYLLALAKAFDSGTISTQHLTALSSHEAKQRFLTQHKGIGIWTANYVLMKTIRESDSIPYGDSGLVQALKNFKVIQDKREHEKTNAFFRPYVGWQSYLSFYLWRSLYDA